MSLSGQVTDDFSDGEFTSNPTWSGTSNFGMDNPFEIIEMDNQLRSQDLNMGNGTRLAYLNTPNALDLTSSTAEWSFRFRLAFPKPGSASTNSNNTSRVYLMSSSSNFNGDLNGYYVELRYPDSDINEVRLFRQDAGTSTELTLSGTIQQLTSQSFVDITVSRSEMGLWKVEVNAMSQGTVTDNSYSLSSHFGVQVRYTANSRDNGFYFDDFDVTVTPVADTNPPAIQSITAVSATKVNVRFSENVDATTAQNTGNYAIDGSVSVTNAVQDVSDNSLVHLTTDALTNGSSYTIIVNNVEDESGNAIETNSQDNFEYLVFKRAVEFDVVINEFMASPGSGSGVPDAEYVELYNRSSKFINLENWTISDATGSSTAFSTTTLRPDKYVILTSSGNGSLFTTYGDVLEISNFPPLNNSGDNIRITNSEAIDIHQISYSSSAVGVSTELINPNGLDYSENNFGLSGDSDGGTPGEQNSVFDDTPDTVAPMINSVSVISNTELDIVFDEVLEAVSAEAMGNYAIDGSISIVSVTLDAVNKQLVHLVVNPLVSGEVRTLTVNNVRDLSGNAVVNETTQFEYIETEEAEAGDVIINEFLSNPVNNPDDFIELYNKSGKFINMLGWNISDESSTSEDLPSFILRPGAYLIIYDEDATIDYTTFGSALTIASLTLNNADDQIEIVSSTDIQIDFLAYREEQEDGVSLELVNPDDPCLSLDSYSASINPLGSTPGSRNSVFDDTPDTDAPTVQSFNFDMNLTVNFSEVMDATSLASGTYSTSGGLTINQVIVSSEFPTSVEVSFDESIEPGVIYNFTLSNVTDCVDNVIEEITIPFGLGRFPTFNELIMTEVMFDPEPQTELPNREFIEIYNSTSDILTTAGINLTDASATVEIPDRTLNPGEYYVLTTTSASSEFSGNVIGMPDFPSLNNSGEQLVLSLDSDLIFSLTYNPEWHNKEKADGGYSLEMKDVTNPCLENSLNWVSSEDVRGGTPGMANSVMEIIPDNFGPEITSATALSQDSIRVDFSEKIDSESAITASASLSPPIDPDEIHFNFLYPYTLTITLSIALEESLPYTLNIENVTDCSGNEIERGERVFALPVQAEDDEIKLSEVLFNPRSNGVDFVEIYNTSEKYISLKNWKLATLNDEGEVDDEDIITSDELVIDPGQYLVFTTDSDVLLTNYPKSQSTNFFEKSSLPSYPNDEGTVILIDHSEIIKETFYYNEDYHYNLLKSVDGVSLERVSFIESTNNGDNWRSTAATEGFATPGYVNSQSFLNSTPMGRVTVSPEVFIPGNTGSGRDFTTINYRFNQPGKFANVNIYDRTGRLVKNLAQGVLLSTSGFLRWDGDTDDGKIARMGYYLITFEIYDSSGNSEIIKETVVVGRDF